MKTETKFTICFVATFLCLIWGLFYAMKTSWDNNATKAQQLYEQRTNWLQKNSCIRAYYVDRYTPIYQCADGNMYRLEDVPT